MLMFLQIYLCFKYLQWRVSKKGAVTCSRLLRSVAKLFNVKMLKKFNSLFAPDIFFFQSKHRNPEIRIQKSKWFLKFSFILDFIFQTVMGKYKVILTYFFNIKKTSLTPFIVENKAIWDTLHMGYVFFYFWWEFLLL